MPPIHSARPWIYCKKPGFFFWMPVSLLLWISLCIPTLLPLPEAKRLGKELHHYAIDNNDHLLSDEYMRLLWIREELAKSLPTREKATILLSPITSNLLPRRL